MPPDRKILQDLIKAQTRLEAIKKTIQGCEEKLKFFDENELRGLRSAIKSLKGQYKALKISVENYENEQIKRGNKHIKLTYAEKRTLKRIMKENMVGINQQLHNVKKEIDKQITSLQDTVVDPLTKTELQSLTPIAMSQLSTVVDSLTPIAMSQLSTVVDPLTPSPSALRMSQLSTVVEKEPEDINEEIKRRVIENINKYFAKKRKFKNKTKYSKKPPNLPPIEIDVREFLKKKAPLPLSSPPTSPIPPPSKPSPSEPRPKQKEKQLEIGAPPLITKSMQQPKEPYICCISPSFSGSPSIIELGGTRDLFQTLYAQSALLSAAISSGQLSFSMGGSQFNFSDNMSLFQRQVNTFNNPTGFKIPSKPTPSPDKKISTTTLEKILEPSPKPTITPSEPVITPKPIITPDKKDPSKVIVTTVIPEPNSPKPAAVIVSKVKITKEDKKRLRKEREEISKQKVIEEIKELKDEKSSFSPSISNHSVKENSSVSTSMSTSSYSGSGFQLYDPAHQPPPPPPVGGGGFGPLGGGAGSSASTISDYDDSISYAHYNGGNGGGSLDTDMSIRTQGEGHFMEDVNKFINHNLSKNELFQPEPSKRSAENIDPLAQQAQIVPYWETNGLENIGALPPSMTTSNGAFNKPVTTNPQKFVFMTYQSGINKFYNCKLPMKVNIPSGDFGIYKVTVNEVLFRTDMNLLDADDYIDFTFNDPIQIIEMDEDENVTIKEEIKLPPLRISLASWLPNFQNLHINYLNIDSLVRVLEYMIASNDQPLYKYAEEDDQGEHIIYLSHILSVEKQRLAGVGMFFKLVDYQYQPGKYVRAHTCSFNISNCSTNFRHILPPLQTTTVLSSTKNTFFNFDNDARDVMENCNSIYIPRCNFAGPQLILFNSSAQTTCPISNEYAKQFNTCALSYNTNEDTNSLIQMTSNVELTMKNTNEFRVWLTDNYGEPIKIQSPIYVQVTVQPFVNETSTAMNE